MASTTFGCQLEVWKVAGPAWIPVLGLTNLTPPEKSADAPADNTSHDAASGVRTNIPVKTFKWSDCVAEMNDLSQETVPDPGQALLDSLFGTVAYFRVTKTANPTLPVYFSGEITVFAQGTNPLDGIANRQLTIAPSGDWPTKIIAPAGSTAALLNGGFETLGAGGADVFLTWMENIQGGSTVIAADTTNQRAGLICCLLSLDSSGHYAYVDQPAVLTAGKRYRVSLWAKRGAAGDLTISEIGSGAAWTQAVTLTTSWVRYSYDFTAAAAGISLNAYAANALTYIDDVTLSCLTP